MCSLQGRSPALRLHGKCRLRSGCAEPLCPLEGRELPPPPADTMCGALVQYLTTENKNFQPMGANMGILPPLPEDKRPRDKRLRYMAQAERAVASFQQWLDETAL
mgnify:CR=1 FL=1